VAAFPRYADAIVEEFEVPRLGTLALRLRVWCTSSGLTRQLAAGASAVDSRELALRAGQITGRRMRELMAASIVDLVDEADGHRPIFCAQVRIDRPKVVLTRVLLIELVERLRSPEPVTPGGMALILLLLTDPARPLYGLGGARDLAEAIVEARQMLDGFPESRLEA
jgi:hypothetical protein